jgi:hypothetical protein
LLAIERVKQYTALCEGEEERKKKRMEKTDEGGGGRRRRCFQLHADIYCGFLCVDWYVVTSIWEDHAVPL